MFQGISFSDPENGWIVDYDKIFHTNDGGVNWVIQYSDTTKSFYNVFFTDFDYGWVVGWPGVILYTTNGGEEWMEQASGTNFGLHNIVFTDPDCGWVVGVNGIILHTNNGGVISEIPKAKVQNTNLQLTNFPNPFNISTTIEFTIQEKSFVSLSVYDLSGKLRETITLKKITSGKHEFKWNAQRFPSGIYFCVLRTEKEKQITKLIKMN